MPAWPRVMVVALFVGLIACNGSNPLPVCPPVYPTATLRLTPARVQVPAQVRLTTEVNGLCPDLRVAEMQFRVIVRSGSSTVADGVAVVKTGVSFTLEQSWNVVAGQAGVPAQGKAMLELTTSVQISASETITSRPVILEVDVP